MTAGTQTATALEGVQIKSVSSKGKTALYVVVDLGEKRLFSTPPSLLTLSLKLHLSPEVVLKALLSPEFPWNAAAACATYLHVFPQSKVAPGIGAVRRALGVKAQQEVDTKLSLSNSGIIQKITLYSVKTSAYLDWKPGPVTLVLPLSSQFQLALNKAEADRARNLRLLDGWERIGELTKQIAEIQRVADEVWSRHLKIVHASAPRLSELSTLTQLQGLAGVLAHGRPDDAGMTKLVGHIDSFVENATRQTYLTPADQEEAKRDRDTLASRLRQMLDGTYVAPDDADQDFSTIFENMQFIVEHHDVAPIELWDATGEALKSAYTALMETPEADAAVSAVDELILEWASRDLDLTNLSMSAELPNFVPDSLTPPKRPSRLRNVLTYFAALVGVGGQVAGNLPGPASVSVVVAQHRVTSYMQTAPTSRAGLPGQRDAERRAATLYRFLCNATGLPKDQRGQLAEAIAKRDLAKIEKLGLQNFQTARMANGFIGLANMICFVAVLTDDEEYSLKKFAQVTSFGATGASGVITAFRGTSDLLARRAARGTLAGLGVLATVAGAYVAFDEGVEALDRKKYGKAAFSVFQMDGAAFTVLGFLITEGIILSSMGLVPVGVCFTVLGLFLTISGTIGSGLYDAVMGDVPSKKVFRLLLDHYGRKDSPYSVSSAGLADSYESLRSAFEATSFWTPDSDQVFALRDLGFDSPMIAAIIAAEVVVFGDDGKSATAIYGAGTYAVSQVVRRPS